MTRKLIITGATGLIGRHLVQHFHKKYEIIALTRNIQKAKQKFDNIKTITFVHNFDTIDKDTADIEGIINLAGKPIDVRWTNEVKSQLKSSRMHVTQACIDIIKRLQHKPKFFLSGSAIGYYGSQFNDIKIDEDTKISTDNNEFTHSLCKDWESCANQGNYYGVRVVNLRTGIVLSTDGGALARMLLPFKLCLGGIIADGTQYFSWIHIDDYIKLIKFLITTPSISGAVNCTAPNPCTNEQLTKALGTVLHRPTPIPMYKFMVNLLFGEMGIELLTKGQRVIPQKLLNHHFQFDYQHIEQALQDIIHQKK